MLDAQELGALLRQAKHSLFRLEMQPAYDVPTDGNDFQRYLAGEPLPDMERKGRWLDLLRQQRVYGISRRRVRVLSTPLSDYDRYASEWGYSYNVREGDDTRIVDLSRYPWVATWIDYDFWLVDNYQSIQMNYAPDGQFVGAEVVDLEETPRCVGAEAALWVIGEPFEQWWQRNTQYHRSSRKAS